MHWKIYLLTPKVANTGFPQLPSSKLGWLYLNERMFYLYYAMNKKSQSTEYLYTNEIVLMTMQRLSSGRHGNYDAESRHHLKTIYHDIHNTIRCLISKVGLNAKLWPWFERSRFELEFGELKIEWWPKKFNTYSYQFMCLDELNTMRLSASPDSKFLGQ